VRFPGLFRGNHHKMDRREAAWFREMASWLPGQVRLLGYSPAFREALVALLVTARAQRLPVRKVPDAFRGQEGEEALYQFAERIQGLLELADREAPKIVRDLEKIVRSTLTSSKAKAKKAAVRPKPRRVASSARHRG
jgi:hypothetical protein